jgi:hypothetical protein
MAAGDTGGTGSAARDAVSVTRDHALLAYVRWMTPESVSPDGAARLKTRREKTGDEAALGVLVALLADLTGRGPLLERADLVGLGLERGVLRRGENMRLESVLGLEPTMEKVRAGSALPRAGRGSSSRRAASRGGPAPGAGRRAL